MISVTCMNNVKRATKVFSETDTVRKVFEESGVDCSRGTVNIDGKFLRPEELDNTLAAVGAHNNSFLSAVQKADNA